MGGWRGEGKEGEGIAPSEILNTPLGRGQEGERREGREEDFLLPPRSTGPGYGRVSVHFLFMGTDATDGSWCQLPSEICTM